MGFAAAAEMPNAAFGATYVRVLAATICCLLALPVLLGIGPIPATPEQITLGQAMLSLVGLTLLVWQTAVRGHIVRHALDASFAIGVLIAIGFLIAERVVSGWLFAPTP